MKIDYLINQPQTIPIIARWYFDEWGYLAPEKTLYDMEESLSIYLNDDKVPLMLVATDGNKVVGTVQLKFREMSIYPDKEHWLGGVYVAKSARGKNFATLLINRLIEVAQTLGVKLLHLQTLRLDGGLYEKLGWQEIEQVTYRNVNVLVMERKLSN